MVNDSFLAFIGGAMAGVVVFAAIFITFELTPKHTIQKMQADIVAHGCGKWKIDTSSTPPVVTFEWITHTNQ